MTARQILVVDDELGIRELLRDILQDEGYQVRLAENAAEARQWRQKERQDMVLLDIWMPDCDGISLLKEWANSGLLTIPVVMMSGHGTIDTAVEATRIGAFDFLEKPVALQKLLKTVSAALKHSEQVPKSGISLMSLGRSTVITELRERLEQAALLKTPLLLIATKGSGAELCARFLHQKQTPWLELTQTEKLVASPLELLEQVREGILFVPEVADLNKAEQRGLLLFITKAAKYGTRIICATSHGLPDLASAGKFDETLLQALSSFTLRVPTLNEHCEDIPDLAKAMAALVIESGEASYKEFDVAALNALRNTYWPGNLEQLENVVRNLMLSTLGEKIELPDINRVLEQFSGLESPTLELKKTMALDLDRPLRELRDDFERLYFEYHISKSGGNMSKVADAVELERTHLYRKLKQLGIKNR